MAATKEPAFDYRVDDAMAMPVAPVPPGDFDLGRYAEYALRCDERYAEFLRREEGVAVWQRVRVGPMFRGGCRDMRQSLRWQLGGLTRAMEYISDTPAYLEPWYGIGTTVSAFGGEYAWFEDKAPAVHPVYGSISEVGDLVPREFDQVPIMVHTLEMIDYFLEQTQGRLPVSWSDIQAPINVATSLVDASGFFVGFYDAPEWVKEALAAIAEVVIAFTQKQSELIGDRLARPGHGFASSRAGTGIGLSEDNIIMIAPRVYIRFCAGLNARIGEHFGGTAIHSCGNWGNWIEAVKTIPNLTMVDGAFGPRSDPDPNRCEVFRDALVGTGVVLQARIVGEPDEVLAHLKRLWAPGLKLLVVTNVKDPQAQHQLYRDIHAYCS